MRLLIITILRVGIQGFWQRIGVRQYLDNHEFGSDSDTIELIVGEGINETAEKSLTFQLKRAQLTADPDPVISGFGPITQQLSFKAFSDTAANDELKLTYVRPAG